MAHTKSFGKSPAVLLSAFLGVALLGLSSPARTQVSGSRLAGDWRGSVPVSIAASAPVLPASAVDRGEAPGGARLERMILLLQPSAARQQALTAKLAKLQDSASPDYHRWLTPASFAASYANSPADVAAVAAWLSGQGLEVAPLPASLGWIEFSGTAAQVEQAFGAKVHAVTVAGMERYALAGTVSVPAAFQPMVKGLVSLDGILSEAALTAPLAVNTPAAQLAALTSTGSAEALTPQLLARLLHLDAVYSSGFKGDGQTIAIAARSNVRREDIAAFRSTFGLPASALQATPAGNDPGRTSDEAEADLAASWAGAAAPGAQIVLVPAATTGATDGVDLSLAAIVDGALARTVVVGYSACESALSSTHLAFYAALYRQAAAEGISVIAATGDSGASACHEPGSDAPASGGYDVNALASTPWNTAIGVASFGAAGPAGGLADLSAWSASNASEPSYAGGGGASKLFAAPSWQPTPAVAKTPPLGALQGPAASAYKNWLTQDVSFLGSAEAVNASLLASNSRRLPDLSLPTAIDASVNPGLVFCMSGASAASGCSPMRAGGSSAAAALFAGIAALLDQKSGAQGDLNPTLYQLSGTGGVYADATEGSAQLPCAAGSVGCDATGKIGFPAAAGYDLATGLGAVDAKALWSAWPAAVPVSNSATTATTFTASVPSGGFVFTSQISLYATVAATPIAGGGGQTDTLSGNVFFYAFPASLTPATGSASYSSTGIPVTPSNAVGSNQSISTNTAGNLTVPPCQLPASNIAGNYDFYSQFIDSDGNYSSSDWPGPTGLIGLPITVGPAKTTATFPSSNPNNAYYGTPIALTAQVVPYDTSLAVTTNSSCTVTGSVTFTDSASSISSSTLGTNTVGLSAQVATLPSVIFTTLGQHNISAAYSPGTGTNWQTSTPTNTLGVYVSPAPTSVTLSSISANVNLGTTVTLAATVAPTNSAITSWNTMTGLVTFYDGSTALGSSSVGCSSATSCAASFPIALTAVGSHSFTAQYAGVGVWAQSAVSNAVSTAVSQGTPTLNLSVSPTSSTYGSTIALTATLYAPGTATTSTAVTGTVKFYADFGTAQQLSLGTGAVTLTGNSATVTSAALSGGNHTFTVVYSGDSNWLGNTFSNAAQITVALATSQAVLSVTPTVLTPGAATTSVTLTAALSPASSSITNFTLTGTVTFKDGNTVLGQATVSSNSATLAVILSNSVNHSITAVYSGDTNFTPSTSAAATLTATVLPDNVVLTASPATAGPEQAVVLTVTVTPSQAPAATFEQNPSGKVVFYDGTTVIGSASLAASIGYSSTATLVISNLPAGNDTITAVYAGDGFYEGGTSNAVTVNVQDFSITPSSTNPATNLNIVQGAAGTASYVVAGLGGFNNEIQIVCAVPAQDHMTCTASPQQLTPTGTVTFTVATFTAKTTASTPVANSNGKGSTLWPRAAGGAALAMLGFFLLPFGRRARIFLNRVGKQARRFTVLLLLLVGLSGVGIGCTSTDLVASSTNVTPLGVATLTITASAYVDNTVVSHSVYLTVNVVTPGSTTP
jgi:hypothetical protein